MNRHTQCFRYFSFLFLWNWISGRCCCSCCYFFFFFIRKTTFMNREEKLYGTHIHEGDKNPIKHDDGVFSLLHVCALQVQYSNQPIERTLMDAFICFAGCALCYIWMVIRSFRQQHDNLDALSSWVIKDTLNRHRTWFSTSNTCNERNIQNYMCTKIMVVKENPSACSAVSWVYRLLSFSSSQKTQLSLRYLCLFCIGWISRMRFMQIRHGTIYSWKEFIFRFFIWTTLIPYFRIQFFSVWALSNGVRQKCPVLSAVIAPTTKYFITCRTLQCHTTPCNTMPSQTIE